MSNSYLDAIHIFTKLLQPKLLNLKEIGYSSVIYIDFSLLGTKSNNQCITGIKHNRKLNKRTSASTYTTNKCIFAPTPSLTFLGIDVDFAVLTI